MGFIDDVQVSCNVRSSCYFGFGVLANVNISNLTEDIEPVNDGGVICDRDCAVLADFLCDK